MTHSITRTAGRATGPRLKGGLAAALLSAAVALAAPAAGAAPGEAELTPDQRALAILQVPPSNLNLDVWINHANAIYKVGQYVEVFVRANKPAYVTIFNTNAAGQTHVIFPNAFSQANRVAANQVVKIPGPGANFRLQVNQPLGANLIKVVASEQPTSLYEAAQVATDGAFRSFKGSPADLARQIEAVSIASPQAGWAAASMPFTVATQVMVTTTPSVVVSPVLVTEPVASGTTMQGTTQGTTQTGGQAGGQPSGQIAAVTSSLTSQPSGFELQVNMPQRAFRDGDALSLSVTAEQDCELTLVNVDQTGQATVLFPNRMQEDNELDAGKMRFLPGSESKVEYRVAGAPGEQALIAFCTKEKPGFFAQLFGQSRAATPVLAQNDLQTVLAKINQEPPENVARTLVSYTVTPGN